MEALKERIRQEGQNLGRGILKIDSFLNHQIDAALLAEVGEEIAARFAAARPTRILTAEVSGIIPAAMTGKGTPALPTRKRPSMARICRGSPTTKPHRRPGALERLESE